MVTFAFSTDIALALSDVDLKLAFFITTLSEFVTFIIGPSPLFLDTMFPVSYTHLTLPTKLEV